MDAYVLGTHEGGLPTHLLGDAGRGRVRAMGSLEGSPHSIYVAVDGDSPEAIADALSAVNDAIDAVALTLNPETDGGGTVAALPFVIHMPSRIPPPDEVVFIYVEADGIGEALQVVVDTLGPDGVAVAGDGEGRFIVELGGSSSAAVESAAAAFAERHGGAVVARVSGGLAYAK